VLNQSLHKFCLVVGIVYCVALLGACGVTQNDTDSVDIVVPSTNTQDAKPLTSVVVEPIEDVRMIKSTNNVTPVIPDDYQSKLIVSAQNLNQNGEFERAIETLSAKSLKNIADARFLLGAIYAAQGDDKQAATAFDEAVGLGHGSAIFLAGQTHYRLQNYKRSSELFANSYLKNVPERKTVAPYLAAAVDYYANNKRPGLVRSMQLRDALLNGRSFEEFVASAYPVNCEVSKEMYESEYALYASVYQGSRDVEEIQECKDSTSEEIDQMSYNLLKDNPEVLNSLYEFLDN